MSDPILLAIPTGAKVKVEVDPNKNIIRVGGQGTMLGSCPLDCDTAYWEVVVGQKPENLQVGIKKFTRRSKKDTPAAVLDGDLRDSSGNGDGNGDSESGGNKDYPSWSLTGVEYKEGDVIGVFWDQTDKPMLSFSLNGERCDPSTAVNRVRPANDIHAAVSVGAGSTACVVFDGNSFAYPPASKFEQIICATNLI